MNSPRQSPRYRYQRRERKTTGSPTWGTGDFRRNVGFERCNYILCREFNGTKPPGESNNEPAPLAPQYRYERKGKKNSWLIDWVNIYSNR